MNTASRQLHESNRAHGSVDLLSALSRTAALMRQWNIASEETYLEAGGALQTIYGLISTVRQSIARSTELLSSQDTEAVDRLLNQAVEEAGRIERLTAQRSDTLKTLGSGVGEAVVGSTAVSQVFRLLDYIVLMARTHVEGRANGDDELDAFMVHVSELVRAGQTTARTIDDHVQMLDKSLARSNAISSQSSPADEPLTEQLSRLAGSLTAQRDLSAGQRATAQEHFSAIATAISGVVAGLQFHDIARQRLEHTIVNLGHIAAIATGNGMLADGVWLDEALHVVAIRRLAQMEHAQLTDLAALYELKMSAINHDVGTVADKVGSSADLLSSMFSRQNQAEGSSAIAALEREAASVAGRFSSRDGERRRLHESLRECTQAATALTAMTKDLENVEHLLRIASFNAAIRAANLESRDDTIGYLALEIRNQATVAKDGADLVRAGIHVAAGASQSMEGETLPQMSEAEAMLQTSLGEGTASLQAIDKACQEELRKAEQSARDLPGLIARVPALMNPHLEGCELMLATADTLTAILAMVPPPPGDEGDADLSVLRQALAGQYTMAEERQIFEDHFGVDTTRTPAPAAPPPSGGDDFDDILF